MVEILTLNPGSKAVEEGLIDSVTRQKFAPGERVIITENDEVLKQESFAYVNEGRPIMFTQKG
ncbi:hypothetical protein COT52_02870 [candidate division WWE3 bacterium CG08_land_8_20_14_0_20_43_13]|uniref:Uncharacterized protein n=1 Tax=candidate division WWE3 bacterium CG08_land_8_20_14_0_20_43_13 TaxID=1975087 RepID=A0A2H0X6R2_UNCKA|nr:MAG: hypothetical protein COT52_02870 [candidate division WWE3 bacterium CG08_land_8_20_14_0_20_43_13]